MNKELEKWIEYNNPYQYTNEIRNREHPDILRNEGFWEGAKAMAEHLEERQRAENDAAFLLGMDSVKSQPPTAEQLIKVFEIYYSDKVEQEDLVDKDSDFEPIVKQILEHWNDE